MSQYFAWKHDKKSQHCYVPSFYTIYPDVVATSISYTLIVTSNLDTQSGADGDASYFDEMYEMRNEHEMLIKLSEFIIFKFTLSRLQRIRKKNISMK